MTDQKRLVIDANIRLWDASAEPARNLRSFSQHLKEIALHDHLPDYRLIFDEEKDMVAFFNREGHLASRSL